MNDSEDTDTHPRRSRLPNLKEQDPALLIAQAARAFERTGERFHLLAGMSHGPIASRWRRMAWSSERVAVHLRLGSSRYEQLRVVTKGAI